MIGVLASALALVSTVSAPAAPLARGELMHTYGVSFVPNVAQPPGLRLGMGHDTVPRSMETWYSSTGRGMSLSTAGAFTLRYAPFVHRDKHGEITGIGGRTSLDPGLSRLTSLQFANSVNLIWMPLDGGTGTQRSWVRTKRGYESAGARPERRKVDPAHAWGATYQQIAALPDGRGPALDDAVARLLVDDAWGGSAMYQGLPTGADGETVATRAHEQRIDRAMRMLASAPLNRAQRAAILNWMARQPGARLTKQAKDRDGRRGSAISFRRIFDQRMPARTVSATQLVDEARAAGGVDLPATDSTKSWQVDAHRAYRRWLASVVYDPATMRLLQSATTIDASRPVDIPEVFFDRATGYRFELARGASARGSGGGTVWYASEPVRSISPLTPVCERAPLVCRR